MQDLYWHSVNVREIARRYQAEAEQARVARLLPRHPGALRLKLAAACYALAEWLEGPAASAPALYHRTA